MFDITKRLSLIKGIFMLSVKKVIDRKIELPYGTVSRSNANIPMRIGFDQFFLVYRKGRISDQPSNHCVHRQPSGLITIKNVMEVKL